MAEQNTRLLCGLRAAVFLVKENTSKTDLCLRKNSLQCVAIIRSETKDEEGSREITIATTRHFLQKLFLNVLLHFILGYQVFSCIFCCINTTTFDMFGTSAELFWLICPNTKQYIEAEALNNTQEQLPKSLHKYSFKILPAKQ